jgi:hypothetical protein
MKIPTYSFSRSLLILLILGNAIFLSGCFTYLTHKPGKLTELTKFEPESVHFSEADQTVAIRGKATVSTWRSSSSHNGYILLEGADLAIFQDGSYAVTLQEVFTREARKNRPLQLVTVLPEGFEEIPGAIDDDVVAPTLKGTRNNPFPLYRIPILSVTIALDVVTLPIQVIYVTSRN